MGFIGAKIFTPPHPTPGGEVGLSRHIDLFSKVKLGEVLLVVIVLETLENKVNSEPDLFKFVQIRSVGFQVGLDFDNTL